MLIAVFRVYYSISFKCILPYMLRFCVVAQATAVLGKGNNLILKDS